MGYLSAKRVDCAKERLLRPAIFSRKTETVDVYEDREWPSHYILIL